MDGLAVFLAVAVAILLGAMSPGPSFIVVARTAISSSRGQGVLAALGMGLGGSIFALAACLGLHLILTTVPSVYRAMQIAGAAYLLFISYRLWVFAPNSLDVAESETMGESFATRSFLIGLGTQISNPKTAIVYASVFAAALPQGPSLATSTALVTVIFLIEFGWYALVAIIFSTGSARQFYARGKTWIDRLAAGAMGSLGVKILSDVRST
jgi:threonine/homoserine/homoserine lactone efflux protein